MSGSMRSGNKITMAKKTAIALGESLRELNLPFEISGFTSTKDFQLDRLVKTLIKEGQDISRFNRKTERIDFYIFKDFESDNLTPLINIKSYAQNPDGECLRLAGERLANRKEPRKILFVLSDGQPATGEGNFNVLMKDLKLSIEELEFNNIEVVGFGILTDYVEKFYPKYVIINDIEDLPTKTMQTLSDLLINKS